MSVEAVLWRGEKRLQFDYLTAGGERTRRDLIAGKVVRKAGGQVTLQGYSLKRAAPRALKPERIVGDVLDADTGEVGELWDLLGIDAEPAPPPPPAGDAHQRHEAVADADVEELLDYLEPMARKAEAHGWVIHRKPEELSVHGVFKNGRVKKGAVAAVRYFPEKSRPLRVEARHSVAAGVYSRPEAAAGKFEAVLENLLRTGAGG
ncbi:hypothetical protein SAMN05660831_02073 [Thiohalospira halophila DSM 15071]|uniref:Uncharacterized protein n=1 Tax=Thiohalospira halophila DSM 15071 TaxID=1123397 RepID=A0A1I1U9H3_9GAMM|nr:hypothetical protein [Thiohalospira halophila]SFD67334.1 hypothetical protein SAMN05660831_02073 [Thiohalospira halophila DSM 15071]